MIADHSSRSPLDSRTLNTALYKNFESALHTPIPTVALLALGKGAKCKRKLADSADSLPTHGASCGSSVSRATFVAPNPQHLCLPNQITPYYFTI